MKFIFGLPALAVEEQTKPKKECYGGLIETIKCHFEGEKYSKTVVESTL